MISFLASLIVPHMESVNMMMTLMHLKCMISNQGDGDFIETKHNNFKLIYDFKFEY